MYSTMSTLPLLCRFVLLWARMFAAKAADTPVVPLSEAEKIEKLIVSVETLEGAVFESGEDGGQR